MLKAHSISDDEAAILMFDVINEGHFVDDCDEDHQEIGVFKAWPMSMASR